MKRTRLILAIICMAIATTLSSCGPMMDALFGPPGGPGGPGGAPSGPQQPGPPPGGGW